MNKIFATRKYRVNGYFVLPLSFSRLMSAETEGHATTSCQRQRAERMLLSPRSGAHVPMCQPNGSYADLQCDLFSGYCWCVDREGRELKGTRSKGQVTCDRSGVSYTKALFMFFFINDILFIKEMTQNAQDYLDSNIACRIFHLLQLNYRYLTTMS